MIQPDMLTSIRNPWVRSLRQLHRSKGRREQQQFIVEGTHLLQEAIATQWPLEALCFTPAWAERHVTLLSQLPTDLRQQPVSDAVLAALATTQMPDGVVAIARHRPSLGRSSLISRLPNLALAAVRLQDPGNLGTLIRTAVAAAADGIWLSPDSVDPENPKVLRASAGQWFRCPPQVSDLSLWLAACRQQGIQVLAATAEMAERPAVAHWHHDLRRPTVVVLGNEGQGLPQEVVELADDTISIPMAAGVESLNVGITGALILYEAYRQRHEGNYS